MPNPKANWHRWITFYGVSPVKVVNLSIPTANIFVIVASLI
jgi:hypothetical protein